MLWLVDTRQEALPSPVACCIVCPTGPAAAASLSTSWTVHTEWARRPREEGDSKTQWRRIHALRVLGPMWFCRAVHYHDKDCRICLSISFLTRRRKCQAASPLASSLHCWQSPPFFPASAHCALHFRKAQGHRRIGMLGQKMPSLGVFIEKNLCHDDVSWRGK